MAAQTPSTVRIDGQAATVTTSAQDAEPGDHTPAINYRGRMIFVGAGLAATLTYFLLSGMVQDSLYDLFGIASVTAIVFGVRRYRPHHPLPWLLFALGLAASTAGDITYNIYENIWRIPAPFPSSADAFYLAAYPTVAIGLTLLIRGRAKASDWSGLLDALIITIGLGIVSWVFLMSPYATDYSVPLVTRLISISYPLMDVLWLGLALRLLFIPGARTPAYRFLIAGIVGRMVADAGYAAMVLAGTYQSGVAIDAGWLLGYLFFGAAALHPTMRSLAETAPMVATRPTHWRLGLLAGASVMPLGVFTLQSWRGARIDTAVIVGGSLLLFLLVFIRMAGLLRRHEQSVEREQILSRAGTTLLTAVDLEAIYAAALQATSSLVPSQATTSISILVGSPDSMRVVAREGAPSNGPAVAGAIFVALPPDLRTAFLEGRPIVVEETRLAAMRPVMDITRAAREVLAMPLLVQQQVGGAIVVVSGDPLPGETRESLKLLSTQVALTLDRAALSDHLHRRQSEARFRSLVQHAQDIITIVDANGTISYQSPSVERVLGYTPEAMLGADIFGLAHPDDLARAQGFQAAVQSSTDTSPTAELRVRHHDGSWRDIEHVGNNLLNDPNIRGMVLNLRDVTERKKVDRMKSEFVSTVSHELRTPLTSIRGSLGLIVGGVAGVLPPQASAMIDIAYKNSERLVRLINDILDIEKIESGKMTFELQVLELVPLVEQSLEANRGYADQFGVTFTLEQPAHNARAQVDTDSLMQVLANLLSNAAKFSPPNGVVTITITQETNMARVTVADQGAGIPEAFRGRIFQKFAQADTSDTRQKGGTGLGLSISKAIIEKHGGRLDFTTSDTGTAFYFELPMLQPAASVERRSHPDTHDHRILICEDDQDIATLLAMVLRQEGYQTDTAYTAAEARHLLAQHAYDAMTLDLMLPDEDGVAFMQTLRSDEHSKELPIIVVSSAAGRETVNAALGVIDWLSKPIDTSRLLRAVHQAVDTVGEAGQMRILHVEDDPDIVEVIGVLLRDVAQITGVDTLQEARQQLAEQEFDLIILDVGLPDGSGLGLLPTLNRPNTRPIPVLVFSAQEVGRDVADQVAGTLVKTRTSNEQLLQTITSLIRPRLMYDQTITPMLVEA